MQRVYHLSCPKCNNNHSFSLRQEFRLLGYSFREYYLLYFKSISLSSGLTLLLSLHF